MRLFLGDGLITSEGSFHHRQRRMVQPAFHHDRLAAYASPMILHAERVAANWQDGETRDIADEMMRLTLSIVARTLFNADIDSDAARIGHAMHDVVAIFKLMMMPCAELLYRMPIPPVLRLRRAMKQLDEILYGVIADRRRAGVDDGSLLSTLLLAQDEQDGLGMSDRQLRDECMTLLLAGHETTASALTWTFYLLSQNPEAEAVFHRELDEVLGNEPLTAEHYPRLRYTRDVLAESLRLCPPVWMMGRSAVADHEFNGFRIRKGAWVITSQYVLHRDPELWDRAGEFLPERWRIQSTNEAEKRFVYFPFARGARSCIGEGFAWMECVLLLAALGRKWRLKLDPSQMVQVEPAITLKARHGMHMTLMQRRPPAQGPLSCGCAAPGRTFDQR
jgi:cytochrome P450